MSDFRSAYFRDPKIKDPIYDLSLPFADYILQYQTIIDRSRLDSNPNRELALQANLPFELRPDPDTAKRIKYGALLVHGLFDSPFIMRDVGEQLKKQGILVRAILLPGHGTVPGALLNSTYQQWMQAITYGVHTLKQEVDKLLLVGLSTGGGLSVYHALMNANIEALILFSPAFKINSLIDFSANWHRCISWAWEKAKWGYIAPEEADYAKYTSFPYNSVYQVYQLIQAIKKLSQTRTLSCPVLMGLTWEDKIVKASTAIHQFRRWPNEKNRLILYSKDPKRYLEKRIISRNAIYPEMNISSIAHAAIPVSPTNSHYGMHGDWPLASHIDPSHYQYASLDKIDELFYSYLYRVGLVRLRHRRLTFNPDFDFLASQINEFIACL